MQSETNSSGSTAALPIQTEKRPSLGNASVEAEALGGDVGLQALLARMQDDDCQHTSLASEYTRRKGLSSGDADLRAEFVLLKLARPPIASAKPKKPTARTVLLQEQQRRLDERHKAELSLWDDLQDFMRQRARLEMEYAHNLQKLAQQFLAKRKWSDSTFTEGQENITLTDLYKQLLKGTSDLAQTKSSAAERILRLAAETFEMRKEEKKSMFRTGFRVLNNLHERLHKVDENVDQAKKNYDAVMREMVAVSKKAGRKKGDNDLSRLKSLESKSRFVKNEYMLELAAANSVYLSFRDEQLPELFDTISQPSLDYLKVFFKSCMNVLAEPAYAEIKQKEFVQKYTDCMSVEFERRTFLHEHRNEFPGRQMFDAEVDHGREMEVNSQTAQILKQMRNLLQHRVDLMYQELEDKEQKLESLRNLHQHYRKVGDVLDKTQNQATVMRDKMEAVYSEIEDLAQECSYMKSKMDFITSSGVDDIKADDTSNVKSNINVVDISEAQERENQRKQRYLTDDDVSEGSGSARASSGHVGKLPSAVAAAQQLEGQASQASQPSHQVDASQFLMETASSSDLTSDVHAAEHQSHFDGGTKTKKFFEKLASLPFRKKGSHRSKEKKRPAVTSMAFTEQDARAARAAAGMSVCDEEWAVPPPTLAAEANAASTPAQEADSPPPPPRPAKPSHLRMGSDAVLQREAEKALSFLDNLDEDDEGGIGTAEDDMPPPPPPLPILDEDDNVAVPPPLPSMPIYDEVSDEGAAPPLPPPPINLGEPGSTDTDTDVPPPLPPPPVFRKAASQTENARTPPPPPPKKKPLFPPANLGVLYRALYDYGTMQQDDIPLAAKETIYVLVERTDGWSQALNMHGQVGFVPTSYIEQVQNPAKYPLPKAHLVKVDSGEGPLGLGLRDAKPVVVEHVASGSRAELAGLKMGDMLLRINDFDCAGLDMASLQQYLQSLGGVELDFAVLNKNELIEAAERTNAMSKRPSNMALV